MAPGISGRWHGVEYLATLRGHRCPTPSPHTITITPKAADKVREFIAAEDDGAEVLRIAVQGGGC